MKFIDTNVWMYAVGRPHPLRIEARDLLRDAQRAGDRLFTSAEVLQELLHAYLPVGRATTLRNAMTLVTSQATVVPLAAEDVELAAALHASQPALQARDLAHLAVCLRHDATALHTFDRGLAEAFRQVG